MTNSSKSLLEYSKSVLLPEGYVEEGFADKVKEKAKKVEDKSREHLGDKTTEAIKGTAKEVAGAAAKSVKDKIVQKATDKSGDIVISASKWALQKLLGKK
jgi:ElaB/YqjD/DUF883 family membrane-anchored ribosome-binding protein